MPKPSPSPVARLIAKTLTLVTCVSRSSPAKVAKIARTPIASGSRAATRLPNTMIIRIMVIGTAIDSATARSLPTWVATSVPAQDRLFQMDYLRRVPSGTLAELLGPAALPSDVQLRTIGLRRAAERSWQAAPPLLHAALTAYAAGVNAYVQRHPLPP